MIGSFEHELIRINQCGWCWLCAEQDLFVAMHQRFKIASSPYARPFDADLLKWDYAFKCDFRISKSDSLNDFSNICTETQSHRRREVCHPLLQKAFDHFFDVRFGGNAPGIIFV